METILSNAVGKLRKVWEGGREYYVVPMTTIVPGVLSGSQGALYYSPAENVKSVKLWDGFPLPVYHPTRNGQGVGIDDLEPEEMAETVVGEVRNTRVSPDGSLKHDGWIDALVLRNVDTSLPAESRIEPRLLSGRPVELSTGLFTTNVPSPGVDPKGRPYNFLATRYRPDHIAILPDQVGACSLSDGCGVLVNVEQPRDEQGRFAAMPAAKLHKEIEKLRAMSSAHDDELIAAERGTELPSETSKKTDELSSRVNAVRKSLSAATGELKARRTYHGKDHPIRRNTSNVEFPAPTVLGESLTVNPFVSESQRRACYTKDDPDWDCHEWSGKAADRTDGVRKSDGVKLPESKADNTKSEGDMVDPFWDKYFDSLNVALNAFQQHRHAATGQMQPKSGTSVKQVHTAAKVGSTHPTPPTPVGASPVAVTPDPEAAETTPDAETPTEEVIEEPTKVKVMNRDVDFGDLTAFVYNSAWPVARRNSAEEQDFAGPNRTFPIANQDDLDAAVTLLDRASNPAAVKARIRSIANRRGLKLPGNWVAPTANVLTTNCHCSPTGNAEEDSVNDLIANVLANGGSPPGHLEGADRSQVQAAMAAMHEGGGAVTAEAVKASKHANEKGTAQSHRNAASAHREAAEHHEDEGNTEMSAAHDKAARSHAAKARNVTKNSQEVSTMIPLTAGRRAELITNAVKTGKADRSDSAFLNRLSDVALLALNAEPSRQGTSGGGTKQAGGEEDDPESKDVITDKVAVVDGPETKLLAKNVSVADWLKASNAPPEVAEAVTNSILAEQESKADIARRLVANAKDTEQRKRAFNRYMAMTLADLKEEAALHLNAVAPAAPSGETAFDRLYLSGGRGPTDNARGGAVTEDDDLPLPRTTGVITNDRLRELAGAKNGQHDDAGYGLHG